MYYYYMFMYIHRASWHSSATLIEVFRAFYLSCKANARVNPLKDGARTALFQNFCVVLYMFVLCLCVLFVCKYVLYYCHRVPTQLQLTNISYHISYTVPVSGTGQQATAIFGMWYDVVLPNRQLWPQLFKTRPYSIVKKEVKKIYNQII